MIFTANELECQRLQALFISADKLLHSGSPAELSSALTRLKENLKKAYLSDLSADQLDRFLELQFRELLSVLDHLSLDGHCFSSIPLKGDTTEMEIFGILDDILKLRPDRVVNHQMPRNYALIKISLYAATSAQIKTELASADAGPSVIAALIEYLEKFEKCRASTFYALSYYERFLAAISSLDLSARSVDNDLHQIMLEINFNDLTYISCYQDQILNLLNDTFRNSVEVLAGEQNKHFAYQFTSVNGCYPQLPHLGMIIYKWSQEYRSSMLSPQLPAAVTSPKLSLNMPVAQLALITRLMYGQQLFGDLSLTELFKFICNHFSSKRQERISPNSFSKEYYSVNQITASRVMDLLQQMVVKIKRDFFPG